MSVLAVEDRGLSHKVSPDVAIVLVSGTDGGHCTSKEQPVLRVPAQRRGEIQLRVCPDIGREGGLSTAGCGYAERGEAGTEQQDAGQSRGQQPRSPSIQSVM